MPGSIYISLEPYVRRWWPHTLISWARLLSGRVRDPLVGRDILAGLLAGIGLVALLIARVEVSRRLGVVVSPLDQAYSLEALRLVPYFGLIVYFGIDVLNFALAMLGTLLLIRVIVRNQRVSVIIWVLSVATLNLGVGAMPWDLVFAVALAAFAVFVLLRFGLFSTAVMLFFTDLMTRLPITLERAGLVLPALDAHDGADRRPGRLRFRGRARRSIAVWCRGVRRGSRGLNNARRRVSRCDDVTGVSES